MPYTNGQYKTPAQSNINWVQTWEMTVGAPAIAKRIYDTKAHAEAFLSDPTAIAGLILRVVADSTTSNNGSYEIVDNSGTLGLKRLHNEQSVESVTPVSGAATLSILANTYYTFTTAVKTLTISAVQDSNLESELMFDADSTDGATISLTSGIQIGSLTIPKGAKVFISVKHGTVAIYHDKMPLVDTLFDEDSGNLATSAAIATWVNQAIINAFAEYGTTVQADWTADDQHTLQKVLHKPTPLLGSGESAASLVERTIYDPGQSTGCLHANGLFSEVQELPNPSPTFSAESTGVYHFTNAQALKANTIYHIEDTVNVTEIVIDADDINDPSNNTAETILYFKTGPSGGYIYVEGNNRPVILGTYDDTYSDATHTQGRGQLMANTRYVVNYKDGIIVISPTENFVTAVAKQTGVGTPANIVSNGVAVIPLFKLQSSDANGSGIVPPATGEDHILRGSGWGSLFVSSKTSSDVKAGVFFVDTVNSKLCLCTGVSSGTAEWLELTIAGTSTSSIS